MSLFTREESRLRFADLRSESDVADALAASLIGLQQLKDEAFKAQLYEPHRLAKKGIRNRGEFRVVYEVARDLRRIHTEILESLRAQVEVGDRAFGFVRGRSTLMNAREHHGARMLLNVDIRDFFDSIREPQVVRAFRSLGTAEAASRLLATLCCLDGRVPQGAATSPILSNIVCVEMDRSLQALAARKQATYTRYADDLSFSGDAVPDLEQIEEVLAAHGFAINAEKTFLGERGEQQYVTGLTIGSPHGVRLPRRFRRYLRLELHYAHEMRKDSEDDDEPMDPASDNGLSGRLAYAFSVEPTWTIAMLKKFPLGAPDGWASASDGDEQ